MPGFEPGVGASGNTGSPVAAVGHHIHAGPAFGRHGSDAANLRLHGLGITFGELRHATAAATLAALTLTGPQHQQVRTEAGDLGGNGLGGTIAKCHHRDHGADANDDAQHCQE